MIDQYSGAGQPVSRLECIFNQSLKQDNNQQAGIVNFVNNTNSYYKKAEAELLKYLKADGKSYTQYFSSWKWVIKPGQNLPCFE